MSCQERAGFLFAHGCDRPVAWSCATCGKAICAEHTRMTETGYGCISCVRLQNEQAEQEREKQEQEKQGQGEGDESGTDDPYFYANDDYDNTWDPSDRRAFSNRSSSTSASDEADADFGAS